MRIYIGAVDPGLEVEHAASFPLLQHDIVEGEGPRVDAVGANDARFEQGAFVAFATAFERRVHGSKHVLGEDVGEEAQPAAIDANQGYAAMGDEARRIEKCSVAANRDDQVCLVGDFVFGNAHRQVGGHVEWAVLRQ